MCLNLCSEVCQLFLNKTQWGKPSGGGGGRQTVWEDVLGKEMFSEVHV